MVKDIYKSKERFERWKEANGDLRLSGLSKTNSALIKEYLNDMETGSNTARGSKKGGRSHARLNTIRIRVTNLVRAFDKKGVKNIARLKEKVLVQHFHDMRSGKILKADGTPYKSTADFVKDWKSFWHWLMKVSKKKEIELEDITVDLDTSKDKPPFVYFTKEQMEKMLKYFKDHEQTLLLFMFDTIIRTGKELSNVKVSDLYDLDKDDHPTLSIREATSKTFGRDIKILICGEALRKHIRMKELSHSDFLFNYSQAFLNRKLKQVAIQLFGDKQTKGGKPYSQLRMYDFRHSGACHWRKGAYKTKIDALMYRGGWNNLDMLNYYTRKMGMKDTVEEGDLFAEADKTRMEKEIEWLRNKLEQAPDEIFNRLLQQLKGK